MPEGKEDLQAETPEGPKKKGSKILIIVIAVATIVLGAGGFLGFKLLAGKNDEGEAKAEKVNTKFAMVALEPFVLNLSDHGRYLKVTIQLEVADESLQKLVVERTPQLRDTIITLVSSKSLNSITSPEGKFQLKDEVL